MSGRSFSVHEARADLTFPSRTLEIARHALRHFVLHASLIRPLGEAGKLKLTSDMTELEFATSQLLLSATSGVAAPGVAAPAALTLADCGEDFKALRSFR